MDLTSQDHTVETQKNSCKIDEAVYSLGKPVRHVGTNVQTWVQMPQARVKLKRDVELSRSLCV